MDLIRRLPRALLVTALSLLFLGGTTGMVVAAGEPDVPRTLQVAQPHVGDRWQYELELRAEGPGLSDAQRMVVAYEWLPAELLQDAQGQWHSVHPLFEQQGFGEDAVWHAYLVDAASGEVVAVRDRLAGAGQTVSSMAVGNVEVSETQTQEHTEHITTRFQPFPPFCGFRSELQGREMTLDGVQLEGFCGFDLTDPDGLGWKGSFRPAAVEEVEGVHAVRLHRSDVLHEEYADMAFNVDVWLAPHLPYPVKLLYRMDFDLGDLGKLEASMTMRMTGFEAGQGAWGTMLALPQGPVPAVLTAPRQPWGPDDAGVQHPFPLSEAWRAAQADTEAGAWFDDHPRAKALAANFTRIEFEDRVELRWDVWAVDRRDQRMLQVTRVLRDAPHALLLQAVEGDTQVEVAEVEHPLPAKMPETAPTVSSVQARWQTMRPDAGTPNTYGFWPSCACKEAHWKVSAGRVTARDTTPALGNPVDPAPREYSEDRDVLIVSMAEPEALQTMARRGSTYERGLVSLGSETPPDTDAAIEPMASPAGIWGMPSPPAAASVAAGAFLIGLVYWLWPVIKSGGAVGLFSRVQRDQLLDHPTRRAIHEAIDARPGIHYQALIRTVAKGRGTVEHHLRKLQQGGYVVAHRNEGHTCFFVRGAMDHSVMAAVPAVRTDGAARVLAHVQAHPGIRVVELASALGVARSTASHHVRRLKEAGLIGSWADGSLSATQLAAPALAAVAS